MSTATQVADAFEDFEDPETRLTRTRRNAADAHENLANADNSKATEAVLQKIRAMHQQHELQDQHVEELEALAEAKLHDQKVHEGLESGATSDEIRALITIMEDMPENTHEQRERKQNMLERALSKCGTLEVSETETIPRARKLAGPDGIRERYRRIVELTGNSALVASLERTAENRLASLRRARAGTAAVIAGLLLALPFMASRLQLPIWRTQEIGISPFVYQIKYVPDGLHGGFWYLVSNHAFLIATLCVLFCIVILRNRIPGQGIAWLRVCHRNWPTKLCALAAWLWIFTLVISYS